MLYHHDKQTLQQQQEFENTAVPVLSEFLHIPLTTNTEDGASQLKKLQHGSLDTIGLVLALHCGRQAKNNKPSPRIIEVIADSSSGTGSDKVAMTSMASSPLHTVLGHLRRDADTGHVNSLQYRVCMANAVIACVQHLARLYEESAAREMLYKQTSNTLLAVIFSKPTHNRVKAAAIQVSDVYAVWKLTNKLPTPRTQMMSLVKN